MTYYFNVSIYIACCYNVIVIYFCAGIDSEGHPANYVETEQIVQFNSSKASFVQVSQRGEAVCCKEAVKDSTSKGSVKDNSQDTFKCHVLFSYHEGWYRLDLNYSSSDFGSAY